MKKLQITDDVRKLVDAVLEAAKIEVFEPDRDPARPASEEIVSIRKDDLVRIVGELVNQHSKLHEVREFITNSFPAVHLYQGIDEMCSDFHERFPNSKKVNEVAEEATKKARADAAASAAQQILGMLIPKPGAPDPGDLN